MEKCGKYDGICFQDSLQLFSYNDDIRDDITNAWFSNIIPIQKFINLTLVGNITGNAKSEELVKTKYTLKIKEFRKIILGIKSTGGCGIVSQIKVYYFVCSELPVGNRVILKKTSVPQNGTKVVFGSCSVNAGLVSSTGDLKAFCYSNGSWSLGKGEMVCRCEKGYEPTSNQVCSGMFLHNIYRDL